MVDKYFRTFHLTKEYNYGRITRSSRYYFEHDPATSTVATAVSLSVSDSTLLSATTTTGSLLCPARKKLSISRSASSGKSLRATRNTATRLWTTAPSDNVPDRVLTRGGKGSIIWSSPIRGWCNGSTKDFGSFCRGSNPCPRVSVFPKVSKSRNRPQCGGASLWKISSFCT